MEWIFTNDVEFALVPLSCATRLDAALPPNKPVSIQRMERLWARAC